MCIYVYIYIYIYVVNIVVHYMIIDIRVSGLSRPRAGHSVRSALQPNSML